jgi:rhamnose transport system ATP-binding protein
MTPTGHTADAPRVEAAGDQVPAVTCAGLSRTFGATTALSDVTLEIKRGTIHALVGENGAGKSTCLGIIAGRIPPTSGEVRIFGEGFSYGRPRAAQSLGVAAVYQELTVIPQLKSQVNAFLSQPMGRGGWLSPKAMRRRYVETCERLGIPPAPDVPAGELPVAAQQLIEIVRAVSADARLILLDEPTTALAVHERDALFAVVHSLREQGVTIVFVSHNLDEVLENADQVTVFREGRLVADRPASDWTKVDLVGAMLGAHAARELSDAELGRRPAGSAQLVAPELGGVLLEVDSLNLAGRLEDVGLELRAGEILGIAGLMGSGRTSLVRSLAGAEPDAVGHMQVAGRPVVWPRRPRAAQRLGIALIPEDRKTQGLALGMSSADNVALPDFGRSGRFGFVSPRRILHRVTPLLRTAGVDAAKLTATARTLSGGNQQKLLFARAGYQEPRILLCDEPTRGVDIGAKTDLLNEIRRLARDQGLGVILVSSELEEVVGFSDRVLVLAGGRVRGVFDNHDRQLNPGDLLAEAFGIDRQSQ